LQKPSSALPGLFQRIPLARETEPLTACFGVACFAHCRCARYASVSRSQADPATLGTCFDGNAYPLFVSISGPGREPLG
jgi:hypothetical protein